MEQSAKRDKEASEMDEECFIGGEVYDESMEATKRNWK